MAHIFQQVLQQSKDLFILMSSLSTNLKLEINFQFRNQRKNRMELDLVSMVEAALAQFCVHQKLPVKLTEQAKKQNIEC